MKPALVSVNKKFCRRAFTLVELMIAMSVGLVLAGTVVMLLFQAASEQRRGYADTTVEERAYVLQANVAACLRGMSSGMGITGHPGYNLVTNGFTYGYTSIYVFKPNADGSYTQGEITADMANGSVIYIPNVSIPTNQVTWMANNSSVVLHNFYFSNSQNLDGSQNNSLVNVSFIMDDNGYSRQNATKNVASIQRSFSVQMRCD